MNAWWATGKGVSRRRTEAPLRLAAGDERHCDCRHTHPKRVPALAGEPPHGAYYQKRSMAICNPRGASDPRGPTVAATIGCELRGRAGLGGLGRVNGVEELSVARNTIRGLTPIMFGMHGK